MKVPERVERTTGRHALVDGIPFTLPVASQRTPALMAVFPCSASAAARLLPGTEVHPFRLWGDTGLLVITVVDYLFTNIGRYVEFSIAIACTHGAKAGPALVPGLLMKHYDTGQFVVDLPVSTEVSVKGGKGIWGMPKHQANLDFVIRDDRVWSQYDLDGQLAMRIEVKRPRLVTGLPVGMAAVNFCAFRGMLMKSYIYFRGHADLNLPFTRSARLELGPSPRMDPLRELGIGSRPLFSGFFPETRGVLDDHVESWFLSYDSPPTTAPEGLESVVGLGLGEDWLPPPDDPAANGGAHAPRGQVQR